MDLDGEIIGENKRCLRLKCVKNERFNGCERRVYEVIIKCGRIIV